MEKGGVLPAFSLVVSVVWPLLVSPISAMAAPGKLGSGWTQGQRWGRGAGALLGLEESRSQATRDTVRSPAGHLSPTLSGDYGLTCQTGVEGPSL